MESYIRKMLSLYKKKAESPLQPYDGTAYVPSDPVYQANEFALGTAYGALMRYISDDPETFVKNPYGVTRFVIETYLRNREYGELVSKNIQEFYELYPPTTQPSPGGDGK